MISNKRGYSNLFEDVDYDTPEGQDRLDEASAAELLEDDRSKRRKESYVLHIGPKFRPEHLTSFRATNLQVVKAESSAGDALGAPDAPPTHSLFDMVVDDVRAGTVRAYTGLDIVLPTMIDPESPKVIKMALSQMDVDGVLDETTGGIEVPLYLNLVDEQYSQVIGQLGLEEGTDDVSLVEMNTQALPGPIKKIDPREQFINQLIGRMGRHRTNVQSTWDPREDFFQGIDFKVRMGPQKKNMLIATEGLSRGQGKARGVKKSQNDQFNGRPVLTESETEYNRFLDEAPQETGASHAGVIEHVGFWIGGDFFLSFH